MNRIHQPETGAIAWMANNPVAANLLMLLVMVAGLASIQTITKEVFPTFPSDVITISVPYPGSSPEEVEEGVLVKIEEAIQDLEGIDKLRSTASENLGRVTVELLPGVDATTVVNRIKVRVDGIASFPAEIESPVIEEVLRRTRVLNLTAYGPLDETQLKQLADRLRDGILSLPGITQVAVTGTRDYEISIEISDAALRQYGLRFDEVVAAVQRQSRDLPGGKLRTRSQTISLRSTGQARTASDFGELILISRADGTRVQLGDVARVRDGFSEQPVLSEFNGRPAITLQIDRIGEQDALAISDAVKAFANAQQALLPEGVALRVWRDRTDVLKGRIELLLRNAVQGSILVIMALALFLRPRLAFWVVAGVPFCFLGALMMMNTAWVGLSINVITLFGFILVLGILVDDAIVTAESAYHTLEEEQLGTESIIRGVKRVTTATVFGVLTTIIAFLPMLFLTEGIAQLFSVMAAVVILCLVFSIIETKFILPAHLRHLKAVITPHRHPWVAAFQRFQQGFSEGLKRFAETRYRPALNACLAHRYLVLAVFLACLIVASKLVPSGIVRFVFFPNVPSDFIEMSLQMPQGTPYAITHDLSRRIGQAADTVNARYRDTTGSDINVIEDLQLLATNDVSSQITAALVPSTERTITSVTLAAWWREAIGPLPGIKALSVDANAGRASIPIDIQLSTDRLDTLRTIAEELKGVLAEYDGVFDIRDTFDAGAPEVDVRITAEGEAMGLGQAELARQVRQAFFGAEVQRLQRGRHEVRVYARLPEQRRNNLETLNDLWIRLPDGRQVPFPVVGRLTEQEGISSIQRLNRQRVVNVQADIDKQRVEPTRILADIEQRVLADLPNRYPGLSYSLTGEAEEQRDNANTLAISGLLVICLIYAALAVPLKSYIQPLLIMSVIPFGFVGAVLGHWLLGKEISIISIVGIVALAGIVVNDSLVLIDDINHQRRQGVRWRDAVPRSGVRRFRAVVLTSMTTFVGLLPIQLETSIQAQFLKPMAISVAFGVLFATVVTLLLMPVLCWIADDIRQLYRRLVPSTPSMAK